MARPLPWLLLAFLVLALAAPGAAEPELSAEELDGRDFRVADANTLLSARVVDYWTGLPVVGARVNLFHEVLHPVPGFGSPIAGATTGDDGWVWVPTEGPDDERSGDWAYFQAPGVGPDSRFRDFLGEVVELREQCDVPFVFRDPLDRPVANLGVSLLLGCGHTPDVWIGQTDAKGEVVIPHIQTQGFKQVWIWKPGILSHYADWASWEDGDPPVRHRCGWSMVVEGRILTHDGKPAPGVAVGTRNYHRGPWGYSDAAGDVRVLGTGFEPGDEVYVEPFEGRVGVTEWHSTLSFVIPPPGIRRVYRLPPPGEDAEPPARDATLRVQATIDGDVPEPLGLRVVAARLADGWTEECLLEEDGSLLLELPAGRYALVAWVPGPNATFPGLARVRTEIDVGAGEETRTSLTLPAPRVLRVLTEDWPEDAELTVVTEEVEYDAVSGGHEVSGSDDVVDGVLPVHVPSQGDVFLRCEQGSHDRLLPVPPSAFEAGAEPLRLPWIRPTTIGARTVDADGNPLEAWFAVQRRPPGDYGVLTYGEPETVHEATLLPDAGLTAWLWVPEHAWAARAIPLPSPLPEGEVLDLGTVTLGTPTTPRLYVTAPDGEDLEDVEVRISTATARIEGSIDAEGAVREPWGPEAALTAGATVQVLADPVPWRTTLEGPGPWRLTQPPGRIRVRVFEEDGSPMTAFSFTVIVDGVPVEGKEGEVEIDGLDLGPHEVIVARPDRYARRYRVVLDGTAPTEIDCTLRYLPEEDDE